MKNKVSIIILIILISKILFAENSSRGICYTPEINTENINWEEIRENNKLIKEIRNSEIQRVDIGDTLTFWAWDFSVMPPPYIQVPATCRGIGDSCYVFVADDQWLVHMNQSDVDTIIEHYQNHTLNDPNKGIVIVDQEHFGDIPDELDNDRRVYLFYSELGTFGGTIMDGYFSHFNQMTDSAAQALTPPRHSNEIEMLYLTCYPPAPSGARMISVLAHELQHMIHWNMDEDEGAWVDEGCAEVAMWLYGYPDNISGFPTYPDDNLIVWEDQWSDYIQTYIFMMYMYDHYDSANIIRNIVADTANCKEGIERALVTTGFPGVTFKEVFNYWTIANYMNDTTYGLGEYGYYSIDLPMFGSVNYNSYPVSQTSAWVNSWAADYIKFSNGDSLNFDFDGPDGSLFNLSFVLYTQNIDTVINVTLDSSVNINNSVFPGFGSGYDNVLAIITKISSSGDSNYIYSADAQVGIDEVSSQYSKFYLLSILPNPFHNRSTISLSIPNRGEVKISIFDISGREVYLNTHNFSCSGIYQISLNIESLSAGIYYIDINYNNQLLKDKLIKIN